MVRESVGRFAAVTAVVFLCSGLPSRADTLVDIVQEALNTNPELGAIRFNRRAIDNELNAARGLNLPTVDVRGATGRHRENSRTELGVVDNNDWHDSNSVGTVVSQRLFDGFESRHEIARQRNRVESARWRVNDTANAIALRAVQAYLEIIRANSVLKAAQANLSSHENLNSRVQRRVDGGVANAAERAEAGARTANARAIMAQAEESVQNAQALFKSIVGRMPAGLVPPPAAGGLPDSEESAVAQAVQAAPSVVATHFDAIAAEAAVGSAYSRFSPKVNFEVSTNHGWGQVENNDRNYDASAMLVVRWNLFNGGIDKARTWEARARAAEAHGINANTALIVEREARNSWASLRAATVRVPELRLQYNLQKQRRSAYLEQFDTGQRRLLDLLDAQNEIFVVESSLRTEEAVGIYSGYRLLATMGMLVDGLGLALPSEAAAPPASNLIEGWRTEIQAWPRDRYHDRVEADVPVK